MTEHSMDKDLQELIEARLKSSSAIPKAETRDEELYQKVFEVLNKKELSGPSLAFSNNIIRRLQEKRNLIIPFQWQFFPLAGVVLFFAIVYIASVVYNNVAASSIIHFVLSFKWQLLLLLICYYGIQYADWRLVKQR